MRVGQPGDHHPALLRAVPVCLSPRRVEREERAAVPFRKRRGGAGGAALATVVGVLVEVPVMLSVVAIVKRTRPWYEAGATA